MRLFYDDIGAPANKITAEREFIQLLRKARHL